MENLCNENILLYYLLMYQNIIKIIQITGPILAIISLILTFIQMSMNPDEKKYKSRIKNSIIALVILFLIPTLTRMTINLAADNSAYSRCLEDEEFETLKGMNKSSNDYSYEEKEERTQIINDPSSYEKGVKKNIPNETNSNDDAYTNQGPLQISPNNGIYFLNVGAATDAIIVESDGHYGLIDTSYSSKGNYITKQLKSLGVNKLDFLLITHMHIDHVGGFSKIISTFPVETYITKNPPSSARSDYKGLYQIHIKTAKNKGTYVCDVMTDSSCRSFSLGSIQFRLYNTGFVSNNGLSGGNRSRVENANSIVAVANINGKKIYLAGDIGNYFGHDRETETASKIGDIDVYKAAHHGFVSFNNHQSALSFLKPEYAVVTNTANESRAGVRRIKASNSNFQKVYYTTNGTVSLNVSEDGQIRFKQ